MNQLQHGARSRRSTSTRGWLLALAAVVVILTAAKSLRFSDVHQVDVFWDYDFRNMPRCTNQRKGTCITGFNVFLGEPAARKEQWFVPTTGTGDVAKALRTCLGIRATGEISLCVAAVAKTENGFVIEGFPICTKRWLMPAVQINNSVSTPAPPRGYVGSTLITAES